MALRANQPHIAIETLPLASEHTRSKPPSQTGGYPRPTVFQTNRPFHVDIHWSDSFNMKPFILGHWLSCCGDQFNTTGVGKCPNWTSPNYWGYKFQQIFEGDIQNPQKGTFTNPCTNLLHIECVPQKGPLSASRCHKPIFSVAASIFGTACGLRTVRYRGPFILFPDFRAHPRGTSGIMIPGEMRKFRCNPSVWPPPILHILWHAQIPE